jgi:lantibiotic leader peptide-processing serine protease
MRRLLTVLALLALMSTALIAPAATAAPKSNAKTFMVIATGNQLPANLEQQVRSAGGTVIGTVPQIGVATVTSSSPSFKANAGKIKGVQSVIPSGTITMRIPVQQVAANVGNPPNSGSADFLFDLQWGHTAVGATSAWAAGHRGAGVRVAVLDDGIDPTHPDLAPNLNVALSTSFVPGETFVYDQPDVFSHGAHVAGTIAAAENDFGTIGVAPDAEIVMVKVLSSASGSGSFEGVAAGIIYAADIQSDVINMSLGAMLQRRGFCFEEGDCLTAREVAEVANMLGRATSYAYQRGATIITSAGNDGMDSNKSKDIFHLPSDAPHVISVSAVGPLGWGVNPNTNLNVQAFYTNYGLSTIDLAGPGGNVDFDLLASGQACTVAGVTRPCYVFDFVFSTGNGGWYWSIGTSMAAPHVSGVAALIIGANGGSMHPAQVESLLRKYALDLGKPGKDAVFGHGLVHVGGLAQ